MKGFIDKGFNRSLVEENWEFWGSKDSGSEGFCYWGYWDLGIYNGVLRLCWSAMTKCKPG